jgi:hypothetical protein
MAVIYEREAGGRWDRQLGQGDHLNEVSTPVPGGECPSTIIRAVVRGMTPSTEENWIPDEPRIRRRALEKLDRRRRTKPIPRKLTP